MAETSDIEAERLASAFKPQWRKHALTLGANVALAALLLGVPYVRGRQLAKEERAGFAVFARCLLGGEVPQHPGLAIPLGDRDHFAANVLFATTDWPMRCRKPLAALAPKDAVFLWPSVKQAGADLRAVVKLVDQELATLHRARRAGIGRVPQRPLAALAKLQGTVSLMVKAGGVSDDLDADAIRFAGPPPLAAPARLPLTAGDSAMLQLESRAGTLEAFALDGRGISWLRLDDGKVDRERVKRTGLVRGVVRFGGDPFVVWATAPSHCRDREDRCAQRATGVARYQSGSGTLPTPLWLGGHPAGRADRVLRVQGDHVEMIAVADAHAQLSLRRFPIDVAALDKTPHDDKTPPLVADTTLRITEPEHALQASDAVFLEGGAGPRAVAYAASTATGVEAHVLWDTDTPPPITLHGVAGKAPWITVCQTPHARFVAYGSDSALRVARIRDDGSFAEAAEQPVALGATIDIENAALDRVRLACDDTQVWLFALDASNTLRTMQCDTADACTPLRELATNVATFSNLLLAQGRADHTRALLAFSGLYPAREIRLLRLDASGAPLAASLTPAACWDPYGGMCGAPTLVADEQRVVLAAREGDDLLAIESEDGGAHFETLSGLKVGAALDSGAHDVMQQHRKRKGIDE
ncbi:MAG TPA: hypothetical protein VHM19_11985 [Polyangiales bacterium]|nr:hypothetical protein [Polyangiales bacterium]